MIQFFARLDDDNVVIEVACVTRYYLEANPQLYPGRWVETWRDRPGKTFAGPNTRYDAATEDFVSIPPASEE